MKYRFTGLALAAVLVLSACATPQLAGDAGAPGGMAQQTTSLNTVCNPIIVGLGAAATCGIITRGDNRALAAAACAAMAMTACYLANSHRAEQIRTAQQVESEFLRNNRALPEHPTIVSRSSRVEPNRALSVGQRAQVFLTVDVVPGRASRHVNVEEEVQLVDAKGDTWGDPFRRAANASGEAGGFQTSFNFPISNGMSQGVYTIRRTTFLDGVPSGPIDTSTRLQVI